MRQRVRQFGCRAVIDLLKGSQAILVAASVLATAPCASATVYGPGIGGNIPDNEVVGFLSPIVVPHAFPVQSVKVTINGLVHGYSGDLLVTLTHSGVSTPTTLLINLRNGSSADFNGTYSFADNGANLWTAAQGLSGLQVIPPATYQASGTGGVTISLNSKYFGENAQGSWALRIADQSFLVSGSFASWSLELGGGPVVPPPCPPDLNGDGVVNTVDLTIFLASFGTACP